MLLKKLYHLVCPAGRLDFVLVALVHRYSDCCGLKGCDKIAQHCTVKHSKKLKLAKMAIDAEFDVF